MGNRKRLRVTACSVNELSGCCCCFLFKKTCENIHWKKNREVLGTQKCDKPYFFIWLQFQAFQLIILTVLGWMRNPFFPFVPSTIITKDRRMQSNLYQSFNGLLTSMGSPDTMRKSSFEGLPEDQQGWGQTHLWCLIDKIKPMPLIVLMLTFSKFWVQLF